MLWGSPDRTACYTQALTNNQDRELGQIWVSILIKKGLVGQ